MDNTSINLYERSLKLNDNVSDKNNFKPTSLFRGHVKVVDDISGETILEKDNLVVLRGRTFALEKMFNKVNDITNFNKENLATKRICLWKAGSGGCVEGEPFNLLSLDPNSTDLGNPVPFVIVPEGSQRPEGYYAEHTEIIGANNAAYTYYYAKTFDNIEWVTNPSEYGGNDEIALKITLKITEDDFRTVLTYDENNNTVFTRDTFINEIGLCIANPSQNQNVDNMTNIELATRLNFASEPYFSNLKAATIYYYIYA